VLPRALPCDFVEVVNSTFFIGVFCECPRKRGVKSFVRNPHQVLIMIGVDTKTQAILVQIGDVGAILLGDCLGS
jgi:hypothetical protein